MQYITFTINVKNSETVSLGPQKIPNRNIILLFKQDTLPKPIYGRKNVLKILFVKGWTNILNWVCYLNQFTHGKSKLNSWIIQQSSAFLVSNAWRILITSRLLANINLFLLSKLDDRRILLANFGILIIIFQNSSL